MGEYADMMLEGLIDEETGEYLGDANLKIYGVEAPGFPISEGRRKREKAEKKAINIAKNAAQKKTKCPSCGKKLKVTGLSDHCRVVHGGK